MSEIDKSFFRPPNLKVVRSSAEGQETDLGPKYTNKDDYEMEQLLTRLSSGNLTIENISHLIEKGFVRVKENNGHPYISGGAMLKFDELQYSQEKDSGALGDNHDGESIPICTGSGSLEEYLEELKSLLEQKLYEYNENAREAFMNEFQKYFKIENFMNEKGERFFHFNHKKTDIQEPES